MTRKLSLSTVLAVAASLAISLIGSAPAAAADEIETDWIRQFGTPQTDIAWGVDAGGRVTYVAGTTDGTLRGQTAAGGDDAFVRAYDRHGKVLWTRQFGTPTADYGFQAVADGSGVVVVGSTDGDLWGRGRLGQGDAFLRKYSPRGRLLWTRQFGTPGRDAALNVSLQGMRLVVVGNTAGRFPGERSAGEADVFVASFGMATGRPHEVVQFGTPSNDIGYAVATNRTSWFVTGYSAGRFEGGSPDGRYRAFVARVANDRPRWTRQLDGGGSFAFGVALGAGQVFVGGSRGATAFVRGYDRRTGRPTWATPFAARGTTVYGLVFVEGRVWSAGTTARPLSGLRPQGVTDAFVRAFTARGGFSATTLIGTRGYDESVWIEGSGRHLVIGGWTSGRFPGEPREGRQDAWVARLRI
jgi:hypothetical protein